MMLSICCQLSTDGHCSPHLWVSSPLQNFLNHCRFVLWLAVPGPDVLLMWQVISAAIWQSILNSNKKIV